MLLLGIGTIIAIIAVFFFARLVDDPTAAAAVSALVGALLLLLLLAVSAQAHSRIVVPRQAALYKATVIREVRFYWGMAEKPSMFMAQIHQESGFREDAESAFALGLTQFTKPTAEWIQGLYARDLRELCADRAGCPLDAKWAIRAMAIYDKRLWNGYPAAEGDERRAFMLSAYNGGAGNLRREILACQKQGLDSTGTRAKPPFADHPRQVIEQSRTFITSKWNPLNTSLTAQSLTDSTTDFLSVNGVLPSQSSFISQRTTRSLKSSKSLYSSIWIAPSSFMYLRNNHFSFLGMMTTEEMISRSTSSMYSVVLPERHGFQIIGMKIASVSIDVMNELLPRQHPTFYLASDQAMNVFRRSIDAGRRITIKSKDFLPIFHSNLIKDHLEIQRFIKSNENTRFHIGNILRYRITCNPTLWFENVETVCLRAGWACRENRGYPRRILLELRHHYE